MTKRNYAQLYKEDARKVAEMLSQLTVMKEQWECYMDETADNGDPYLAALPVLEHMGNLLASLVIYQQEYEEDPSDIPEERPEKGTCK